MFDSSNDLLTKTPAALSSSLYGLILSYMQIAKNCKDTLKAFHCIL